MLTINSSPVAIIDDVLVFGVRLMRGRDLASKAAEAGRRPRHGPPCVGNYQACSLHPALQHMHSIFLMHGEDPLLCIRLTPHSLVGFALCLPHHIAFPLSRIKAFSARNLLTRTPNVGPSYGGDYEFSRSFETKYA